MGPGEIARRKRHRERKLAEHNRIMADLREQGANCANCRHRGGRICDLKSDWEGDVRITMDHLCAAHSSSGQKEGAHERVVR